MGKPHQVTVIRRGVDDQEIMPGLHRSHHGLFKSRKIGALVVIEPRAYGSWNGEVVWDWQLQTSAPRPIATVLDVTRKAFLPAVEVDCGHTLAGLQQCDYDVDRNRRLARAPFLVADYDDMRHVCAVHS